MAKKISSTELEQIIAEEIEKTLIDEGFGDFVKKVAGAGKAAAQGAVQKGKEKWKEIGQQQADAKQAQQALSKIATFIEYTREMPEIEKLIKSTKIGQHLFGGSQAQMMEQYESQISKMLKTLNPVELKAAVDEFMQVVSSNPQAATIMKNLTGQDVSSSQQQPEQPTKTPEPANSTEQGTMSPGEFADFMAKNQTQDPRRPTTIPDDSGGEVKKQGPAEPPRGEQVPTPEEPGIPDTTGSAESPTDSPEKEQKAKQTADNIMGAIAGAISNAKVSNNAKRKVRASTEKIRQAVGNEIKKGMQEQKERWKELAGIFKD